MNGHCRGRCPPLWFAQTSGTLTKQTRDYDDRNPQKHA